jgi:hypothetical protein
LLIFVIKIFTNHNQIWWKNIENSSKYLKSKLKTRASKNRWQAVRNGKDSSAVDTSCSKSTFEEWDEVDGSSAESGNDYVEGETLTEDCNQPDYIKLVQVSVLSTM